MTQIDEEALSRAVIALAKFRTGELKDWPQYAPEAECVVTAYLTALEAKGYLIVKTGFIDTLGQVLPIQAYDAGFAASAKGWNGEHPGDAEQSKEYLDCRADDLARIYASHLPEPPLAARGE